MKRNTSIAKLASILFLLIVQLINAQQNQVITSSSPAKIWFDIIGPTGGTGQNAVAYLPQTTYGLDYGFDATLFPENNVVEIYSIVNQTPLVIQARPLFNSYDMVQIGYIAPCAGNYNISIDHSEGIFTTGISVFIKDKNTGTYTDLSKESYFFTSAAGTFETRFEIYYNLQVLSTENNPPAPLKADIYKSGHNIMVNTGTYSIQEINVYTIDGKKLYSSAGLNTTEASINTIEAANQIIIVDVTTEKGRISKKIVY